MFRITTLPLFDCRNFDIQCKGLVSILTPVCHIKPCISPWSSYYIIRFYWLSCNVTIDILEQPLLLPWMFIFRYKDNVELQIRKNKLPIHSRTVTWQTTEIRSNNSSLEHALITWLTVRKLPLRKPYGCFTQLSKW